jgi:DNA gyrase inhibitor GyrI
MPIPDIIRQPLITLLKAIIVYLEDPNRYNIHHEYHYHCDHPSTTHTEDCRSDICFTPNCRYQAA